MEYLNIVAGCKYTDPIVAYTMLNDMSHSEIYDVLELMEVNKFYALEDIRIQQLEQAKQRH